ncbi:MAG: DUF4159 domain-containing protein [Ferrovibrionaceae bacterium]
MLGLGALGFAAPWALLALGALPVLWWLLRVTPPAPKRSTFPPLRILRELVPREETPAHTPWWLLALRLLIAALVVFGLAQPIVNPQPTAAGGGPLVLVIDDGWAAASAWDARRAAALEQIAAADRADRAVVLLTTAPVGNGAAPGTGSQSTPADARAAVAALQPKPWPTDRAGLAKVLGDRTLPGGTEVTWIADGIEPERDAANGAFALAERLQRFGPLTVVTPGPVEQARALTPPLAEGQGLRFRALRPEGGPEENRWLRLSGQQANLLAREPIRFAAGATTADLTVELPLEVRNRLVRAEIEQGASAGTVVLLDERWRRRPVGVVSGDSAENQAPLLSDLYYLDRALSPFNELRHGQIGALVGEDLSVLILADVGQVVGPDRQALADWVEKGGVVIRFAGPRLAESGGDELMPVRLRQGGRQLGGAMSWSQPAKLAAFSDNSPFAGLPVPDDVTVSQQVLAEPDADLPERTWARLEDGTPLVTAAKRGQGWVVLVHTSANADWSTLAFSGLYIDMLRRLIDLGRGITGSAPDATLAPLSLLDGFGRMVQPGGAARPIPARSFNATRAAPASPPGYYGTEDARRALNLSTGWTALTPISRWPSGTAERRLDQAASSVELKPWALGLAMALLLVDFLIGLALRGLLRPRRAAAAVLVPGLVLAGALLLPADMARAQGQNQRLDNPQTPEELVLSGALDLRLAYVLSGDGRIDAMSRAGLTGLTETMWRRTSIEAAPPLGVDLERDEISVFPFLYWPLTESSPTPSDKALARIDQFMKTGGLILFDTRDQQFGGSGPGSQRLRAILGKLDVPPLVPIPPDHVLTKAFYLLQDFPGRYTGGQVWVERHGGGSNDGVSALVIGGNDWASAWAVDAQGRPMAAVVPGGERQREMSYRFGINLVMYTLTGNYKADQVHVPALLERLGQ